MEVLANCFAFLVAGFDTTATTLSLTAYYLAKYPAIQEKMRKEIEEICISPVS
jgi:cytochrome P450